MPTSNPATNLGKKIQLVNDYIGNGHDISCFITFEVNGFKLDTRDTDTFKHYAVSLENKKTGVGQGNEFTLRIIYHKDFADDIGNTNIIDFEKALNPISLMSLCLDKDALDQRKNRCKLSYGYLTNNVNLISPEYEGLLLEYKVKADKQIVEYTLKGYTGIKITTGTTNWYPKMKNINEILTLSDGTQVPWVSLTDPKTLTSVENAKLLSELNKYYTTAIVNPYEALVYFLSEYNEAARNINPSAEVFEIELGCDGFYEGGRLTKDILMNELKPVAISLCRNQTPIQYIEYLISMFTDNTDDETTALGYAMQNQKIENRWVYEFKKKTEDSENVDIWGSKKLASNTRTIKYLTVTGETEYTEKVSVTNSKASPYSNEINNVTRLVINRISNKYSDSYDYLFEGYVKDNNLLLNYELEYDGTVALSVSNMVGDLYDNKEESNKIYIDQNGQLKATPVILSDMFVAGAIDEVKVKKSNEWLDKISCANNCRATVFGLPFEIPTGSVFKIESYIGNVPHHTSGKCFTTGVIDKIENGKFTTELTMIRLPGENIYANNI